MSYLYLPLFPTTTTTTTTTTTITTIIQRIEAASRLITPIDLILLNEHPYVLSPAPRFDRAEELSRDERLRIRTLYYNAGWTYQTILEKLRTIRISHLTIY